MLVLMALYVFQAFCVAMGHHTSLLATCHNKVSSAIECGTVCLTQTPLSKGFVYSRDGTNGCCCVGRNEDETRTPLFDEKDMLCMFKGVINADCTNDVDCRLPNTVCFEGVCLCTPGFSYLHTQHACVRHCKIYGNSSMFYPDLTIKDHNMDRLVIKDVPEHALADRCMVFCSSIPRCRSMDVSRRLGECLVQYVGYLDVQEDDRNAHTGSGWGYLARNCHQ